MVEITPNGKPDEFNNVKSVEVESTTQDIEGYVGATVESREGSFKIDKLRTVDLDVEKRPVGTGEASDGVNNLDVNVGNKTELKAEFDKGLDVKCSVEGNRLKCRDRGEQ